MQDARPKSKRGRRICTVCTEVESKRKGILNMARDWELRVDLEKKLVFPPIVETTQRPDILLISEQTKKLVVIELTVPWETRCQEAHEWKYAKYDDLLMD